MARQRGLAGPGLAHESVELTGHDPDVDPVDRTHHWNRAQEAAPDREVHLG